jgi:hypothetical protein
MLTGGFAPAHQREHTHSGSNSRRFTIDLDFVAMTADWATDLDGDSFSLSFRMDGPLITKTGDFKFWKRYFLLFLSIKAAALIPQLALSSYGVPLNPVAQRCAHAMLVQCCGHNKRATHAIAGVSAGRPNCRAYAWKRLCERLYAQSISRTLSLMDRMMVRQASCRSVYAYVHAIKQHFDDLNE